jgi:hypothetical protein
MNFWVGNFLTTRATTSFSRSCCEVGRNCVLGSKDQTRNERLLREGVKVEEAVYQCDHLYTQSLRPSPKVIHNTNFCVLCI